METKARPAEPDRMSSWILASTDVFGFIVAWMLAVVVVYAAGAVAYLTATGGEPPESWSRFTVGVVLMAAALYGGLRWRARAVSLLLANGNRTRATMDAYQQIGSAVRLTLSYEQSGQPVRRKLVLVRGRRTLSLRERSELTVVFDPDDPRRLTIAELYA